MPFAAALSTHGHTRQALDEVCSGVGTVGDAADLAVLFFTAHHADDTDTLLTVKQRVGARCLIGCVAEAVIGNDREIERRPALSLWLARWSGAVQVEPFHLSFERTGEGHTLLGWPDALLDATPADSALLVLGDPTSFPPDLLLQQVNDEHRGLRVLGGMASGFRGEGACRLLLQDRVHDAGAVGVLLQGPTGLRSIVSQGCRPIGRHYVVTRGQHNVIEELGGRPVLEQLRALWQELSPEDRELFQQGLHIGLVINEYQGQFRRGDFLVRNVLGMDRQTGAIAVGDRVRVGQTVQFHVRDAATADEDLKELLRADLGARGTRPAGALLFSCNGRGTRLFPEPHHDARAVRAAAGDVPLAGFFAQGELGPVGGQNFIHGFTASVALFED